MAKIKDLVIPNEFDYTTKDDTLNVLFYQIPKALIHIDVSAEAKLLYGYLKDRSSLSLENEWFDEQGRVYIICTREEIEEVFDVGHTKCTDMFKELRTIGLIEEIQQGLNKPNIIYVKKFKTADKQWMYEKQTSRSSKKKCQEVSKTDRNNTECIKTEKKDSTSTTRIDLNKSFKEKTNVDGMMVNDRQYRDINDMIQMIATREIKDTTKTDLLRFLHKLYDEKKQDFLVNGSAPIRNLKNFVKGYFNDKTRNDEKELIEIKELAEKGVEWAVEFVEQHHNQFKNIN